MSTPQIDELTDAFDTLPNPSRECSQPATQYPAALSFLNLPYFDYGKGMAEFFRRYPGIAGYSGWPENEDEDMGECEWQFVLGLHEIPEDRSSEFWPNWNSRLRCDPAEIAKVKSNFIRLLHVVDGYRVESELLGNEAPPEDFLSNPDVLSIEPRTEDEIWRDLEKPAEAVEQWADIRNVLKNMAQ